MNRREFIGSGAVGAAAATVSAIGPVSWAAGGPRDVAQDGSIVSVYPSVAERDKKDRVRPDRVVWLGNSTTGPMYALLAQLSRDIFERLIRSLDAAECQYRVTLGERPGDVDFSFDGANAQVVKQTPLRSLWNTSYRLDSKHTVATVAFPYEHFKAHTERWLNGAQMRDMDAIDAGAMPYGADVITAFAGNTIVGMPFLPQGVSWCGHYIDCETGMVMRAMGVWEMASDKILLRCDVVCG